MDSFRNICLTLKPLILMSGTPSVQHPQQLHFVLDHCHYHCPSPSASRAVTLPSEQGSLRTEQAPLPSAATTWAGCRASPPLPPTLSQHHVRPTLGFSFSSDSVQNYYYILHFIIIFFVTFTPTLHSIFLINHNCLVIFKSNECIFAQEYKMHVPLNSLPLRAPKFFSTKPVPFHSWYGTFPSQNPPAQKSWDGIPQQKSPGMRENCNKRLHQ